MLKKGTRAVIAISQSSGNPDRYISVKSGTDFNKLEYGNNALSNDFKSVVLLVAALEDARTAEQVFVAAKKYALYNQKIRLMEDY